MTSGWSPEGGGPAPVRALQQADRADHDPQPPGLVRLHQRNGERLGHPAGQDGDRRGPDGHAELRRPEGDDAVRLGDGREPGIGDRPRRQVDDPERRRAQPRHDRVRPGQPGQTPSQTLSIDRIGKPDWRIVKLTSASKALNASLQETQRVNGTVGYQLTVSLKPDAPSGILRDEIRLVTNDPETPSIPVPIGGQIRGELSATPVSLALGSVNSAAAVQGKFVVRANKPFAIAKVEGNGDGFTLQAPDATRKPLQILTMTYNPAEGSTRGDLSRTFRVTTDLPGEAPLDVSATLHVEP